MKNPTDYLFAGNKHLRRRRPSFEDHDAEPLRQQQTLLRQLLQQRLPPVGDLHTPHRRIQLLGVRAAALRGGSGAIHMRGDGQTLARLRVSGNEAATGAVELLDAVVGFDERR